MTVQADAKQNMGSWLSTVLGMGIIGAAAYWLVAGNKERKEEREAFAKLDLSSMSPRAVWNAALDLGRERRHELAAENEHLNELVEKGARLIDISEGLRRCAIMLADAGVPDEVKEPILKFWHDKWWSFMGFETVLMERLFDNIDGGFIERFREKLRKYDEERTKAREKVVRESDYGQLACSFCGKSQKEVGKIVAGPSVYICDECIDLCQEIQEAETKAEGQPVLSRNQLKERIADLESEVEDLGYQLMEAQDHEDDFEEVEDDERDDP